MYIVFHSLHHTDYLSYDDAVNVIKIINVVLLRYIGERNNSFSMLSNVYISALNSSTVEGISKDVRRRSFRQHFWVGFIVDLSLDRRYLLRCPLRCFKFGALFVGILFIIVNELYTFRCVCVWIIGFFFACTQLLTFESFKSHR